MIPPSTRLRRALQLRSLSLTSRIILSNTRSSDLIRNPDPADRNNTSLHLAARLGLVDVANFLLDHGHEDPGISRNLDGLTPLMFAAQAGNDEDDETTKARVEVGKMIISRFPDCVEIRDKEGMDAFSHASRHGTLPLIHLLLTLPVPLDPLNPLQQPTATQPTSPTRTPPIQTTPPMPPANARLLTRDILGNTPLHQASSAGQLKTLRLLVSLGADHTARNNAHWTPVDYSASVAAEVYLRGLVREREGARVMGNIAAAAGGEAYVGGSGSGSGRESPSAGFGQGPGSASFLQRSDAKRARGDVRLVRSEDEESDAGVGEHDGGVASADVFRGRARTAT